jgi:hypothetical protein
MRISAFPIPLGSREKRYLQHFPIIRGWLHYYGRFCRSAVYLSLLQLDKALARWASQKYKRLRRRQRRAHQWIARLSRRAPALFAHWQMVKGGSVVGAV